MATREELDKKAYLKEQQEFLAREALRTKQFYFAISAYRFETDGVKDNNGKRVNYNDNYIASRVADVAEGKSKAMTAATTKWPLAQGYQGHNAVHTG